MLCGNVCVHVVSDECNAFLGFVMYHTYIFLKKYLSLEVSVLSDIKPFRNLTFYNVLAQQCSLFCNFPSFCIA